MKEQKNATKKQNLFLMCNIFVPLLLGAVLYYISSPDVIFVRKLSALLGFSFHANGMAVNFIMSGFIRNYFLDMLWGYGLVFALTWVSGVCEGKKLLGILFVSGLFSALMEFLSLTNMVSGTFDVMDIFLELLAELFAYFLIRSVYRHNREDKT